MKNWIVGFVGGALIATYLVITFIGPFVLGAWILNIFWANEWNSVLAWITAICSGFIWAMAWGTGLYAITDDKTEDDK